MQKDSSIQKENSLQILKKKRLYKYWCIIGISM